VTAQAELAPSWTCGCCGVSVRQADGALVPLPETWESGPEGDFCLSCRRQHAAEEATAAAPAGCSNEARAKARRAGLIEFEVRRTPDLTDSSIAKACHTSASAVAAARRRLRLGDGPSPTPNRDWAGARR
jgi:hypothetical protein